jgi:hypothetical protein
MYTRGVDRALERPGIRRLGVDDASNGGAASVGVAGAVVQCQRRDSNPRHADYDCVLGSGPVSPPRYFSARLDHDPIQVIPSWFDAFRVVPSRRPIVGPTV